MKDKVRQDFPVFRDLGSVSAVDRSGRGGTVSPPGGLPREEDPVFYADLSGGDGDWVDIPEGDVSAFFRDHR